MIREIHYETDSSTEVETIEEFNLINPDCNEFNLDSFESNYFANFVSPNILIEPKETKVKWGEVIIKEINRLPLTAYRLIPFTQSQFIDECMEYNHKITTIVNTVIYPYMIYGEGYEIPGINILDNTKTWDEDDTALKFYSFFQREGIVNDINIDNNQHDNEDTILANKKTYPIFDRFSDQIRDELIYFEETGKFENLSICFDEIYNLQIFKFCKIEEDNDDK